MYIGDYIEEKIWALLWCEWVKEAYLREFSPRASNLALLEMNEDDDNGEIC